MRLRLIVASVLMCLLIMPLIAQEDIEVIEVGTVEGVINDDNISDRYQFEALSTQQVTIRMQATEDSTLDSRLFLFDEAGSPVADNDDIGDGSRDAQIVFTPEESGVFIIEATRFQQNVGTTSGEYFLTLSIIDIDTSPINPLDNPPPFSVEFTEAIFDEPITSTFPANDDFEYFVVGAQQGDFTSIELITEGELVASIRLLTQINRALSEVGRTIDQNLIFATIPQTGWYLIEVERISGEGTFTLTPTIISDTLLSTEEPTVSSFNTDNDTRFFVFNATINERVFVNLQVTAGNSVVPELTVLDLNDNQLDQRSSSGSQTRVTITAPRSSPYIVQARNLGTGGGNFEIQIRRSPADISKLTVRPASYNEDYVGFISDNNAVDYYRFSGKAGELVTIQMQVVGANNPLDPYLILTDSNLNELIFNDNTSASRSAQITAFELPADGDYFILASRAGLSNGASVGAYDLALTVGEVSLEAGLLTATLEWEGNADLNLFVQTPDGLTISWANPTQPNVDGILQIDSNTGCETPTAQPVEHIYWNEVPENGDYTVWVWYQDNCNTADATPFTLTLTYNGIELGILDSTAPQIGALEVGERFESSIRVNNETTAVVVNRGAVTEPSPQQTASQGGDILIVYNTPITGSITEDVFAQFYQFQGSEGDRVQITVERISGNLDPIVVLRDSSDENLAINDDISPDNRDSEIIYTLPDDGQYVVGVTRFGVRDGTTTGIYSLTVTLLPNN